MRGCSRLPRHVQGRVRQDSTAVRKGVPIGERGIGFDRYELDEWADNYIAMHSSDKSSAAGRTSEYAARVAKPKGTGQSQAEFEKALELVRRKR